VVFETGVVFDVEAERASTLGDQATSYPNNGSSLRRLEVFEAFLLS
jgi:hypothetical protein